MDKVRVESDLPPEFCQYRDEGCEVEPSCLSCHLPRCIHDDPARSRELKHRRRDDEVRQAHRMGEASVSALARRFQISRRTVYRILSASGDPVEGRNNS